MHPTTLRSAPRQADPAAPQQRAGGTSVHYVSARPAPGALDSEISGIARTVLDVLLGYTGLRIITRKASPQRAFAMGFWGATALGVAGYSWMTPARTGGDATPRVTTAMAAVLAGLAASAATVDRRAARAALPLLAGTALAFFIRGGARRRAVQAPAVEPSIDGAGGCIG